MHPDALEHIAYQGDVAVAQHNGTPVPAPPGCPQAAWDASRASPWVGEEMPEDGDVSDGD